MTKTYDLLILGSGPIAAATAYHLTKSKQLDSIGIITQDPTDDHSATYTNAGGSIRWFWDDDLKTEMTTQTANFIKDLLEKGVDLSEISDNYLFLHRGKFVPSLNVSGTKLVNWLLDQSIKKGVKIYNQTKITGVKNVGNVYEIQSTTQTFRAKKVLLALGVANEIFMPNYKLEKEKRQLFVLDVPVDDSSRDFPHVIFPLSDGVVYCFIKKTPEGLRYLVGQEDVVETPEDLDSATTFKHLLEAGLGKIMPFLNSAKVEKVLWGIDAANKELRIESHDDSLFAANCGSAIRSSIWIGEQVAKKISS